MADFDEQWKRIMGEEYFQDRSGQYDYSKNRITEFDLLTGLKDSNKKKRFIVGKLCLDAGCGPGRWTYAMKESGATRVDSFDQSEEAIKKCQRINPKAYVYNIEELKPNAIYDFVICWGVLHHTKEPRENFAKVASQVKKGGMLHVMVYDKKFDSDYDGFRGDTCVEKHEEWEKLSFEEKINMCKKKVDSVGGDIHGWFDAFNPKYNWSYKPSEIKDWFKEEGFTGIKLIKKSHFNNIPTSQVNMNAVKE